MKKFYGKPKDREDAIRMLRKLQGNKHTIYTSLSVIIEERGEIKEYKDLIKSDVYVKKMEDSEIKNYINTYNVLDKAGSYAIQSKFAVYIEKIDGFKDYYQLSGDEKVTYTSVMQEVQDMVDLATKLGDSLSGIGDLNTDNAEDFADKLSGVVNDMLEDKKPEEVKDIIDNLYS